MVDSYSEDTFVRSSAALSSKQLQAKAAQQAAKVKRKGEGGASPNGYFSLCDSSPNLFVEMFRGILSYS